MAASADRLNMVHRNGLRLLRLVNTLLDFSRIEAGRVQATFRPTDLGAYTAELASNFRSACEHAGLVLTVDCPPLPDHVYVDADMWERVVLNLVSNAFKYTLEGNIGVTVRLADEQTAELVVSDTGVGIPEDELPRIFDRFHRIEGQAARTMEGTGIGLALVNELVRLHGGTIACAEQTGHRDHGERRVAAGLRASAGRSCVARSWTHAAGRLPPPRPSWRRQCAGCRKRAACRIGMMEFWTPRAGLFDVADGTDQAVRPSILLADDNADMRDYVMRLLGTRYDVRVVGRWRGCIARGW